MTDLDPKPGELWETDSPNAAAVAEKRADGWYWPDGERCRLDPALGDHVGYTREYVEKLEVELSSARVLADSYQQQRDATLNRVASAAARANMLEESLRLARAERDEAAADPRPWETLRAADILIRGHWNFDGHDSGRLLELADELEREAAEKAKRDRLILEAMQAIGDVSQGTLSLELATEYATAAVDAVLAEAVAE